MSTDIGMEATRTDPHCQSIFKAEGTCLVHQRSSLSDEPVADAVKRLKINLIWRPHFDRSHGWPRHGFGNGRGIDGVGLD